MVKRKSDTGHLNTFQLQQVYKTISQTRHSQHSALIFLYETKAYTRNFWK